MNRGAMDAGVSGSFMSGDDGGSAKGGDDDDEFGDFGGFASSEVEAVPPEVSSVGANGAEHDAADKAAQAPEPAPLAVAEASIVSSVDESSADAPAAADEDPYAAVAEEEGTQGGGMDAGDGGSFVSSSETPAAVDEDPFAAVAEE